MAANQNPQGGGLTPEEKELREQVRYLDEQAMSMKNLLNLKREARKAAEQEKSIHEQIKALSREQVRNAALYNRSSKELLNLEETLKAARLQNDKATVKELEKEIQLEKKKQEQIKKTSGGALAAIMAEAKKRKESALAERNLIKDINKERGVGSKIMDLFRSKEMREQQRALARARAGGGANIPPGGGGTTAGAAGTPGGAGKAVGALAGLGLIGLLAAGIKGAIDKMAAPFKALGTLIKNNLTAPLAQASNLISGGIGGGMGIGGGAISGAGASGIGSLIGGFGELISKIPIVGGLLGGLVNLFKTAVELTLGLDQGLTNFARNLGISKDRARGIKDEFRATVKASDNIVVNETRLMESQVELTKALGVRSRFSDSILENNIKLKEIAGLELETRKAIAQTSVTTGRNAEKLTKSILAQSKAFEFETGVAFEFRDVLNQASKQAGVLGLSFTKYPEKLTKSLMVTKAMGFELKQLDGLASSFLDFESSISKEFEAQVLTGKELNLTKAREAALNNDLVTLAQEINTQVGSSEEYLRMNRIQQDAIAEAVGMTRDGLADTLKQQEYYRRLGATNLKQAQEELRILKERGLTQAEISKQIGEDAYNYITQTSTAERLTEVMNRIKTIFIEFVEKSGILEFITNPQKIQGFVTGLINRLAGAVQLIGDIVASALDAVGSVVGFFGGDSAKWKGLASSVRAGSSSFAGGLKGAAATVQGMNFGEAAPVLGNTVQQGARQQGYAPSASGGGGGTTGGTTKGMTDVSGGSGVGNVYLDGQKVGAIIFNKYAQIPGLDKS